MRKPDDPIVSTERDEERSFYGRWSRRKHLARTGQSPPEVPAPEVPAAEPESSTACAQPLPVTEPGSSPEVGEPPPRELTDADMPALETLGEDDDYSGFMSPGVSEALRTKALRKLFMSSKFNVVDGLNDYDDDFTTFEALGDIVTSDMRHRMEVEAQRAREQAEEEAEEEAERETPAELAEEGEAAPALEVRDADRVEDTGSEWVQTADIASSDAAGMPVAGDEKPDDGDSRDRGDTPRER